MQLESASKKLEQKSQINRHLETVAKFLREENARLTDESEEVERHNKRMNVCALFFYPLSLELGRIRVFVLFVLFRGTGRGLA